MEKLRLCRYGGLSAVKQTHYTTDYDSMTFHGAPERYGIYAFLFPYIDWFLLGGDTGKIKSKIDYDGPKRDNLLVPYKKFSVNGDIWTHIEPHPKYRMFVKEERGNWFRMDSNDFVTMFKKDFAKQVGEYLDFMNNNINWGGNEKIRCTVKAPFKFFSKDHLEIFVPKDTKILSF